MFRFTDLIILRLTRDCNLNCKYCFMIDKAHFKGEMITKEEFEAIIDRIISRRIQHGRENNELHLVFHGGEPLMIGEERFLECVKYVDSKMKEANCKYKLAMQSNGVLINDIFAKIAKEYNVRIGMSFDGISGSNKERTDIKQSIFEEKFNILNDNEAPFSFIIVAGKHNIENINESKEYIRNLGATYKVNYAEDMHNLDKFTNIELSGEEFFNKVYKPDIEKFLEVGQLYDSKLGEYFKRAIIDLFTIYEEQEITGCGKLFCGSTTRMIGVNPDGSSHYCDRYSKEFDDTYVMNVLDFDFLGLNQMRRAMHFNKSRHDIIKATGCDECRARFVCDGGCTGFYRSKHGIDGIDTDIVCGLYLNLYDYIVENLEKIIKIYVRHGLVTITGDKIISIKPEMKEWLNKINVELLFQDKGDHHIKFERIK